jgi:hypothetical protein
MIFLLLCEYVTLRWVGYTVKPLSVVCEETAGKKLYMSENSSCGKALNVSQTLENKKLKIVHVLLMPTKIINKKLL